MAPPVGSEIYVRTPVRVTRINEDGSLNVKRGKGPGRPHIMKPEDVVPPPVPLISVIPAASQPSPGCPATPQTEIVEEKKRKGGLFWTAVVTLCGGLFVGISHALGHRILDAVWPNLEPLLRF